MHLEGNSAIVTAAGRRLGRAHAIALGAAGAGVVVNDADGDVSDAVTEVRDAGGKAVAEIRAVGSAESADPLVHRTVVEFGRLGVMVTNAGPPRDHTLPTMTDEDFDVVTPTC